MGWFKDLFRKKWDIACDPNTSIETLTKLSKDKDAYVRSCVADNYNTPIEILTILSKDKDSLVRDWATDTLNYWRRNND